MNLYQGSNQSFLRRHSQHVKEIIIILVLLGLLISYKVIPVVQRTVDKPLEFTVAGISLGYGKLSTFIYLKTGSDLGFVNPPPDPDFVFKVRLASYLIAKRPGPLLDIAVDSKLPNEQREAALQALLKFDSSSDWIQPFLNELAKGGLVEMYDKATPVLDALVQRIHSEGGIRQPLVRDFADSVLSFMLQHPKPILRQHALKWVNSLMTDESIFLVASRLNKEDDPETRKSLEEALWKTEAISDRDQAAKQLFPSYAMPAWPNLRVPLAYVLSRTGQYKARELLKAVSHSMNFSPEQQLVINLSLSGKQFPRSLTISPQLQRELTAKKKARESQYRWAVARQLQFQRAQEEKATELASAEARENQELEETQLRRQKEEDVRRLEAEQDHEAQVKQQKLDEEKQAALVKQREEDSRQEELTAQRQAKIRKLKEEQLAALTKKKQEETQAPKKKGQIASEPQKYASATQTGKPVVIDQQTEDKNSEEVARREEADMWRQSELKKQQEAAAQKKAAEAQQVAEQKKPAVTKQQSEDNNSEELARREEADMWRQSELKKQQEVVAQKKAAEAQQLAEQKKRQQEEAQAAEAEAQRLAEIKKLEEEEAQQKAAAAQRQIEIKKQQAEEAKKKEAEAQHQQEVKKQQQEEVARQHAAEVARQAELKKKKEEENIDDKWASAEAKPKMTAEVKSVKIPVASSPKTSFSKTLLDALTPNKAAPATATLPSAKVEGQPIKSAELSKKEKSTDLKHETPFPDVDMSGGNRNPKSIPRTAPKTQNMIDQLQPVAPSGAKPPKLKSLGGVENKISNQSRDKTMVVASLPTDQEVEQEIARRQRQGVRPKKGQMQVVDLLFDIKNQSVPLYVDPGFNKVTGVVLPIGTKGRATFKVMVGDDEWYQIKTKKDSGWANGSLLTVYDIPTVPEPIAVAKSIEPSVGTNSTGTTYFEPSFEGVPAYRDPSEQSQQIGKLEEGVAYIAVKSKRVGTERWFLLELRSNLHAWAKGTDIQLASSILPPPEEQPETSTPNDKFLAAIDEGVPVYSRPSIAGRKVKTIAPGTVYKIVSTDEGSGNEWYKIVFPDKREGWVQSMFVKLKNSTKTSSAR